MVATLTAAHQLMPPPQAIAAAGVGEEALRASTMGAVGAIVIEPPTPVDKKSLTKAMRYCPLPCSQWLRVGFEGSAVGLPVLC